MLLEREREVIQSYQYSPTGMTKINRLQNKIYLNILILVLSFFEFCFSSILIFCQYKVFSLNSSSGRQYPFPQNQKLRVTHRYIIRTKCALCTKCVCPVFPLADKRLPTAKFSQDFVFQQFQFWTHAPYWQTCRTCDM